MMQDKTLTKLTGDDTDQHNGLKGNKYPAG